jgi:hypothetical protein
MQMQRKSLTNPDLNPQQLPQMKTMMGPSTGTLRAGLQGGPVVHGAFEGLSSLVGALTCRDRAEERRRGVNPDYASANQLLRTIGTNGDVDVAKLSVEDSKYLGGDLEHTHLVKGLDYALLQKVGSQLPSKTIQALGVD